MKKTLLYSFIITGLALPALASGPVFTDVTEKAGLANVGNGKGIAMADVDGDGLWDLFVSNKGGGNKLYKNMGKNVFKDITLESGLMDTGFTMGSVFFDYDNDGRPDLFMSKGGRDEIASNRLMHNVGGKFVEVTGKAGLTGKFFTYSAAAADFDNDGFLDLYLANYGVDKTNILYKNNGDGTFTDVTAKAGVGDRSWSWSATWADVNNDGRPDLYVVNGRYPAGEPNKLYINKGDGTFEDVSKTSGAADPNWGLGATFADVDADGDLDLYVSNYVGPNALFINDGLGGFKKASDTVGVNHIGWGKSPSFGDFDNDGRTDLYEADCKGANQLYKNNGDGTFTDVAKANPQTMLSSVRSKGATFADLDNDGDLDLFVVNWGASNKYLVNHTDNKNFIKVRLTGNISNKMAVGARVYVKDGKKSVGMADMTTATGFCSQAPQELHFGVRQGRTYDVEVRFPSGLKKVVENVTPGRTLTIEEPSEVAGR